MTAARHWSFRYRKLGGKQDYNAVSDRRRPDGRPFTVDVVRRLRPWGCYESTDAAQSMGHPDLLRPRPNPSCTSPFSLSLASSVPFFTVRGVTNLAGDTARKKRRQHGQRLDTGRWRHRRTRGSSRLTASPKIPPGPHRVPLVFAPKL